MQGDPVRGTLHSTDASAGVAVPMYTSGSKTVRTLGSTEMLMIESVVAVAAVGGDMHLFVGPDATPGTGETVVRGTVGTNGIISAVFGQGSAFARGETPFFIAPAGAADVQFTGWIVKA